MSTETPVAAVPARDQLTKEKVVLNLNEETHEIKAKQDGQKIEKEDVVAEDDSVVPEISATPEKNGSGPPVVVEGHKADDVPVETGLKDGGNADELAEPSPTKDSACEAVETVAGESPVIETVEKSAVESLENETVDKIETEAETNQEIGAVEDVTVEKLEIEAAEKEEEEIKSGEEKVAIEQFEREADEEETIEAGENEAVEYSIACEAVEKEEEEEIKVAIEQVGREADKAEAIEAGENEPIEAIASEQFEQESYKTQAIEKQIDDDDDDDEKAEKPKAETFEANPPIDEASGHSEEPSVVKDSEICVSEVEGKSHEQLKTLLEIERNTEKVLKPDEEYVKEAEEDTKLTHEENPISENADKEAAGEVTDTGLVKEENKIVKTEEEEEAQDKEKNELKKTEVENVSVQVGDRDLVEGKEGEVYKDIKENEEGVGCGIEESKNGGEAKSEDVEAAKDEAKADVLAKAGQKQSGGSGGIISKVKQSIVKVKKAIIGKSPSSKLLSPQSKAEEQVK